MAMPKDKGMCTFCGTAHSIAIKIVSVVTRIFAIKLVASIGTFNPHMISLCHYYSVYKR